MKSILCPLVDGIPEWKTAETGSPRREQAVRISAVTVFAATRDLTGSLLWLRTTPFFAMAFSVTAPETPPNSSLLRI